MKEFWRKIKLRFLRHEIWVAETALELPFFSLFIGMTLAVWLFIPVFFVLPFLQFLPDSGLSIDDFHGASKLLFIFIWGVALTLLLIVSFIMFMWWGRWYLICVGVMFGSDKNAHKKLAETQAKLKALTNA